MHFSNDSAQLQASGARRETWSLGLGGPLHRPAEEGPALIETDGAGNRAEVYMDAGRRQRAVFNQEGEFCTIGPAYIETRADGSRVEAYFEQDQLHRQDGPAVIKTKADGRRIEYYYTDNKLQRKDGGPAVVSYAADGSVTDTRNYDDTEIIERPDGTRVTRHLREGRLHEEDGQPALIKVFPDGSGFLGYYENGNQIGYLELDPDGAITARSGIAPDIVVL